MRIIDWSSDVCSSDLRGRRHRRRGTAGGCAHRAPCAAAPGVAAAARSLSRGKRSRATLTPECTRYPMEQEMAEMTDNTTPTHGGERSLLERLAQGPVICAERSEEHTSELQSLMRNSYSVFFFKKK